MTIPLVPNWSALLDKSHGLFPLGDGVAIPADWEPGPDKERRRINYDPKAIPTPFARAEATRLVLSRIAESPDHELAVRFRLMLVGVTTGVLSVQPDDLRAVDADQKSKYDNLGKALEQVDSDARYFAHVRWAGARGGARSYGITYRSSLFSPHARRAQGDWDELAAAVRTLEPTALSLLADWKAVLAGAGRWTPDRGCAWQRGIDYVLEAANTQPSPGHTRLRDDARFVGPVWLDLPTGRPDEPLVAQPVYLPAHAPEWSKRFVASCKLRPAINSVGDAELQDPGRRAGATIRLPRAGADTQVLALGAGSLELHDAVRVDAGGELWITGRAGEHGIVELLEPATAALESMDRPVQRAHVGACPMLYPDPIRILFQRGLWPESGARDARSARLTDALIRSGATLDPIAVERDGGFAMRLGSGTVQLYLLDRLAEIEVLDLRALGYVLWLVFVGEAEVASELGGQLALSNLDRLLDTKASPFEPRDWVYQRIAGSSGDLGLRTATLARLLVAYPGSEAGMSRVLAGAARSFVTWAHGSELAPLGRPPRRIATLLKLTTGDELTLAVDALET